LPIDSRCLASPCLVQKLLNQLVPWNLVRLITILRPQFRLTHEGRPVALVKRVLVKVKGSEVLPKHRLCLSYKSSCCKVRSYLQMLFSTLNLCLYPGLSVFPIFKGMINFFLGSFFVYVFVNVVIPQFLKLLLNYTVRRNIVQIPTLGLYSFLVVELDSLSCCVECVIWRMCRLAVCLRPESNLVLSCQRCDHTLEMRGSWPGTDDSCLGTGRGGLGRLDFREGGDFGEGFALETFYSGLGRRDLSVDGSLASLKGS